jgi:hypothetical protein
LDQISLNQGKIVSTKPLVVPGFGLLDCAGIRPSIIYWTPSGIDRARRSYVILRNASGETTQNADKGFDLVIVKTLQQGVRMSITTGVRIKNRRETLICR